MFIKVTGLFKNCPAKFPVLLGKMRGHNISPTPDRVRDLAGLSKKPGKVIRLSKKKLARLSNFSKIVRQSHQTFPKMFSQVIELFQKSSPDVTGLFKKRLNRERGITEKNQADLDLIGRRYPPLNHTG
jgi:hypothetical protein